MKTLVTFTYGISLDDWDKIGIIEREISLYKELTGKKIEVSFLTYGNHKDLEFSSLLGSIKIYPISNYIQSKIPICHLIKSFILPFKLKDLMKEFDIIKTNQINGCWIAYIAKILYNKKIIIRGGYEWLNRYRSFYNNKGMRNYVKYLLNYSWIFINELFAYKLADKIILTNEEDLSYILKYFRLKRKFKNDKISLIYNFIDSNLFKPLNKVKKKNQILFIGNLKGIKNLVNLLDAFKDLKDFGLDIIGKGPYRNKLEKRARELGINVNFLGIIPNNKIPEILNQYEIFILPSYYEGNPKVLLEAMSCGIACIGTNIHGINNIIQHKYNGYLCGTSSKEIRNALLTLNKDAALRKKIGENAREFVLKNCSLNSIVKKEYLMYREILKSTNKSKING